MASQHQQKGETHGKILWKYTCTLYQIASNWKPDSGNILDRMTDVQSTGYNLFVLGRIVCADPTPNYVSK